MILTCSNCQSRFVVNEVLLLPDGRKVKCAKCKHVWFQDPPGGMKEEIPEEQEFAKIEDIPEAVKPIEEGANLPVVSGERRVSLFYCFYSGFVLMMLICFATYLFKDPIIEKWEPAAFIYETVFLEVPVSGQGIDIEDIQIVENIFPNGHVNLSFSAFLKNKKEVAVDIPNIEILVSKQDGTTSSYNHDTDLDVLLPGQSYRIQQEISVGSPGFTQARLAFIKE